MKQLLFFVVISLCSFCTVHAQEMSPTDDYSAHQYVVTLLRASPGEMSDLVDHAREYKNERDGNVIIMRHSQGDHWDLMLLEPTGENLAERTIWPVAFQDELLASSNRDWTSLLSEAEGAGLFHIEMFYAAPGQAAALLREREMENEYLEGTGRKGNAIFVTQFGSDVDSFTIGFYPDMISFATDPDLSDEVYHQAAVTAGFKSRTDIGFFLRKFILKHQDTLASQVR